MAKKQCIIKQLLDSVFVISGIIKVSVSVISLDLRLRRITLTSTLIIPDITKTSSNNCLKYLSSNTREFCLSTEDMKIKKEITLTYEELLALGESYVREVQPNQLVRISSAIESCYIVLF